MELCWLKCCLACPLTHFPASVLVTNSVSVKLNTQAALVSSVDGWSGLTAVYLWSTELPWWPVSPRASHSGPPSFAHSTASIHYLTTILHIQASNVHLMMTATM